MGFSRNSIQTLKKTYPTLATEIYRLDVPIQGMDSPSNWCPWGPVVGRHGSGCSLDDHLQSCPSHPSRVGSLKSLRNWTLIVSVYISDQPKKHYRTMPWPNIYIYIQLKLSGIHHWSNSSLRMPSGAKSSWQPPLSQPAAGWKAQKLRHLAVEWDGKALPRHGGPWWSSLSRKIKAMTWRWEWNKFQRSTFSPNGMKSHATPGQSTHLHHEPSDPSGLPSRLPIPQ